MSSSEKHPIDTYMQSLDNKIQIHGADAHWKGFEALLDNSNTMGSDAPAEAIKPQAAAISKNIVGAGLLLSACSVALFIFFMQEKTLESLLPEEEFSRYQMEPVDDADFDLFRFIPAAPETEKQEPTVKMQGEIQGNESSEGWILEELNIEERLEDISVQSEGSNEEPTLTTKKQEIIKQKHTVDKAIHQDSIAPLPKKKILLW